MAGALSALCQAGKKPAVIENGSYVTYDPTISILKGLGLFLIVLGMACNPWVLIHFFGARGDLLCINKVLILCVDALLVGLGAFLARNSKQVAAVDRKTWLLLVITLAFCFLLLEFGSYWVIRLLIPQHKYDSFVTYNDPYFSKAEKTLRIFAPSNDGFVFETKKNFDQSFAAKEFHTRVHMNNIGIREDRDYAGEPIDIAFYGDSFTFGYGVNAGERYSDRLGVRANAFFPSASAAVSRPRIIVYSSRGIRSTRVIPW